MKKIVKVFSIAAVLMTAWIISAASALAMGGADWDNSVISAVGIGVAPDHIRNPMQARAMARRAAVVEAYRMMAESVQGFQLDSESTVGSAMLHEDSTRTKVSAFIRGARVVSEQALPDRAYSVTIEAPMYGLSNSLASAVFDKPYTQEPFSVPSSGSNVNVNVNVNSRVGHTPSGPFAEPAPYGAPVGRYTGLIVDCRGLSLNPAMSPVIKNAQMRPIYGHKNLSREVVISRGMAGYTSDIGFAARAGSNPLIVRAIALDGNNCNPVLSMEDADMVLRANASTGFLDRADVVFVK